MTKKQKRERMSRIVEQLKEMNALIEKATGLKPEGKLINPTKPEKKKKAKKK